MNKIIILDFESAETYITDYDNNKYEDFGDFIEDFNEEFDLELRETNCQWMIVDKLKLSIL